MAMATAEELEAELEVVRLEDELRAAKEAGTVTMEQKVALREARARHRAFREARARHRENRSAPAEEGDAQVEPDAIATEGGVQ